MAKTFIENKVIIAVDFDGTITTELTWTPIGTLELREGCKEALEYLRDIGCDLLLWTCRTGEALSEALTFLHTHQMGYLFQAINNHHPDVLGKYPDIARKIAADFYVDDKTIMGELDWGKVCDFIKKKYGSDLFV
uniref:ORF 1 n=1 Tax=Okubovirus SPO1 TaxID=10685 RepID=Q38422_9CAUD|nr:ORF 1 (upstream of gene gp30) [Bacillus phage SPO1]